MMFLANAKNYSLSFFSMISTVRDRIELFMDLVSKRDYPIYYKLIKKPISMNMIKKRIHSPYYKTIDQFRDDFKLMFDNARIFNEEGSMVYEDANEMEVQYRDYYYYSSKFSVYHYYSLHPRYASFKLFIL